MIMYMLLSMGKHPLYRSDDTKDSLIEKILNPTWEFSRNFSQLAIDFFKKLTSPKQGERYNIGQALMHPWITRRFQDPIPLTFIERRTVFEKE
jgi:calcium/calmodulin-dependent protein kinase I